MPSRRASHSGQQKAADGCICTFENRSGERYTLHSVGPPTKIVSLMCDHALAVGSDFRLISYSTPETIFGDLDGARAAGLNWQGFSTPKPSPEKRILGQVGRLEMLHPRLGMDERKTRQHRESRQKKAALRGEAATAARETGR